MRKWHILVVVVIVTVSATSAWLYGRQQSSSSAGILSAQDYVELQQLYSRYALAISLGDGAAYAGTFVPDGEIHVLQGDRHIVGYEAIAQTANAGRRTPRRNRAWPAPPVISATADGAEATVLFFSLDVSGEQPVFSFSGIYEDALVQTADGWRFKKRTFRHDDMLPVEVAKP